MPLSGFRPWAIHLISFSLSYLIYKMKNNNILPEEVEKNLKDLKNEARELKSLNSIRDHNPKYLLTMDNIPNVSHNGIKQLYVLDWLLDK